MVATKSGKMGEPLPGDHAMSFTPENIKSRLHEQPFKPLQLVTTTGQTYEVYHPDMIFVTVRYLYVGLPSTPNRVVADDSHRIASP